MVGIPDVVRTAAVIGMGTQKRSMADFEVDAKVGFSLDPRRWAALKSILKDDPVLFDRAKPLAREYQDLGPTFDNVDLKALVGWRKLE